MRQELRDLLRVILEWIAHDEKIAVIARDRVPIDHVRLIAFLKPRDGLRSTGRACIRRRMIARLIPAHAIVPFADSFRRVYSEEQPFLGIDVVILEIQTLEPRIVPGEPFGFHERLQQPFLRNPIDAADERFGFVA